MNNTKKAILLVEDEDHDVLFMQLALEKAGVDNHLAVVNDGKQALSYLSGAGKFMNRRRHPFPGLVLLDLKLPKMPGIEVLRWIRARWNNTELPVIIFSSSNQDFDVDSCYQLGADAYIIKPAYGELLETVKLIKTYWLDTDGPPTGSSDWTSIIVPPRRWG